MSSGTKHERIPSCFPVQRVRTSAICHDCLRFQARRGSHIVDDSLAWNPRETDMYLLGLVIVCTSITAADEEMNEEYRNHRTSHCQKQSKTCSCDSNATLQNHDLTVGVSACDVHEADIWWMWRYFWPSQWDVNNNHNGPMIGGGWRGGWFHKLDWNQTGTKYFTFPSFAVYLLHS